ncbi:crossover junction endodeoxyribonuclease RuvC [Enterobacter hormaechei subsp. xiangfangensis]|uniref:crossover junction endodeoxyribonuclease RuvC n=1 Tax=Enterobacter TaxID=547 RepID=UPI000793842A|nr:MULTISPECIES: crossover junction endodeoxyribonuclease RuvC [Enterobacter]EKW7976187.1 crossover junction endodeoxyribonuclease RuvC [Enterobacter hormaechei]ELD3491432.1 crossover junction endodeoxyribonuclease RuvC [Enterobacter hormaechei]MBJ6384425.1 crossover junction endodeoxyribonuclease RuvC [Enterobacter cloacae]MBJ6402162.1 crossover junction endodeoxyribonuclease RuvC [Enterobacter cloacae]MBJ6435175.1 crossover junction endodeoxyribonuclease RuvC [Enterobacter cloacae]
MTAVLGIDPGCSGALVLVTEQGGYIDHLAMPTIKVGTKSRVNGAAVSAWLRQYGITHAYLEQVGAMPGQGTASMFTFGHAAGVAEGILQGLNIPYTLVTPQAWKKSAGLIGSDKDAARSRAIQLYPELRALDAKAKGQAIADALLIARFGIGVK